jgi:hypothetical protein
MVQSAHIRKEKNNQSELLQISNTNVTVAQAGTTDLLEIKLLGLERIFAQVSNAVQALDAFTIQGKGHPDASYVTLFSVAADYTSPAGIMIGSDGTDRTTVAAGGSGWVLLDTRGLDAIKFIASSANIAGSTTTIYAGGA